MADVFSDDIKFSSRDIEPDADAHRLLVYFLPGNPGVVEYYRHFLFDLHRELANGNPRKIKQITTYGHSHDGFELGHSMEKRVERIPASPPYSLRQTIEGVKLRLQATASGVANEDGDAKGPLKVVLVGHSVGAYMLMELVSWWQQSCADNPNFARKDFEIVGGVCLFPTVVDIAKSPRGRIMSWLLALPFLHLAASLLATILSQFIPPCLLNWPKALTPGANPAREYTDLTKAVIESPSCVSQAAYLAADEMRQIREDKWHPSHVWGALDPGVVTTEADVDKPGAARTKLFFYWGRDDYWVDNGLRNKLIERRAGGADGKGQLMRPTMMIDTHEIDHCFSLDRGHCEIVAKQAAEWVRELKL